MSRTQHFRGKLTEILPRQMRTLQEIAKDIIDERGLELNDYWRKYHKDDYVFFLCDELYDEYVRIEGRLFKMVSKELDPDDDLLNFEFNEIDKTFDFEVRFYNGGACLSEMLEKGFKQYNDKETKGNRD